MSFLHFTDADMQSWVYVAESGCDVTNYPGDDIGPDCNNANILTQTKSFICHTWSLNVSLFHNWIETIFYHLLSPLTWWVKCYSSVNVNRNPQIFISKKVHLFIVKMIMISNVHFLLCEDYVAATAEVSWQLWNKEECIFGFLEPKLWLFK